MLRRHLAASALLAGMTAVAGIAASPADAAPAADTITITYAGSLQADPGLLAINVQATTSITSLTAQLVPAQGAPVDVSNLQELSETGTGPYTSQWQVPSDLALPSLGSYQIDVTAADSGGGSLTSSDAGTLHYAIQPAITLSVSPNPYDYDHLPVFSGTLTGTYPDGTTHPLAGQVVDITQLASTTPLLTTTTDSNGAYQVTGTLASGTLDSGDYTAMVPSSDTIFSGTSPSTYINGTVDPVHVTAQVSATQVKYKQSVTVTGTATYLPAGSSVYQPLADSYVQVYEADSSPGLWPDETTTASDGTFSFTLQLLHTSHLVVGAGSWPAVYNGNFLLGPATATLPTIEVALPVHINSVTAKVDAFGKLTVHGCTYVTWELGREHAGMLVSVEYSAHSTGPWTLLGKMRTSIRFSCAADKGYEFVGRFPVKLASAYYRVDWPGSAYLQPATTKAVLAGRHLTKITGLKVSATSVTRNSHLTVSGQLWQDNKGWHAYGGRRVLIILRPRGSTKWYWMAKPHTNSAGHFTATFADPASAHWSAVYEGDKTHYASGAKIINVSVSAGLPGRLSRAPDPGWLSHLVPAVNSAEMAKLLRL